MRNDAKSITIRQLDNIHADECTNLLIRAVDEHPTHFHSTPDDIRKAPPMTIDNADPNSFSLGAFDIDDNLIGVVGFYRQTMTKLAHRGVVYRMYVPKEHAGQGIGRRLMEELLMRARQQSGLKKVNLFVSSANERAKRLYTSLGFVTFGVEREAICVDGVFYDEDDMVLYI